MLVTGIQKSDSYIYIYICIYFFRLFFIMGYYKTLNAVTCAVQQEVVVYTQQCICYSQTSNLLFNINLIFLNLFTLCLSKAFNLPGGACISDLLQMFLQSDDCLSLSFLICKMRIITSASFFLFFLSIRNKVGEKRIMFLDEKPKHCEDAHSFKLRQSRKSQSDFSSKSTKCF